MVGDFPKKSFRALPLDGRTVLVRVDYNVPLDDTGKITDDFRIRASLPTLKALQKRHCKVIVCAHLGRPGGTPNPAESLEPVALRLVELLKKPVKFVDNCIGDKVIQASKRLHAGEILLLENLRFHPGEEANDEDFARDLARHTGAQYFVQDGFGVVHRAHASTEAITHFLPSAAGLLLEKEYLAIIGAMHNPTRPLTAVIGGAKISDKIEVIEKFIGVADRILIGGAMANNFLRYRGFAIGRSTHDEDCDEVIAKIYDSAGHKTHNVDEFIMIPTDVAVATTIGPEAPRRELSRDDVQPDDYILDIGPQTIARYVKAVEQSHTVIWNGTLGLAEVPQFAYGSARVALALAQHADSLTSVIGGGDTADFVLHWDGHGGKSFSHVSTGGGASIELMAGLALPGIDALLDA